MDSFQEWRHLLEDASHQGTIYIDRVVILGVRRLVGGRVGGLAHYAEREPGILDIFSKYSF
jgi:hypothetical protein